LNNIKNLRVSLFGKFIYYLLPYRRSVVLANISQVFQDKLTLAEKKLLAQAFYSHLLTSLKEMLCMRFLSEDKIRSMVSVKGVEHIFEVARHNKGVLILTGHFGSWEFAPVGGILNFKEFQGHFHFIRRNLANKFLEKILFARYYKFGLRVITKTNALQHVLEALGQNHAVVFVLDQHASLANKDGIAAEFFGKKAGTYRSLASIARNTGLPVIPAASYRLENGRHVLEFSQPIYWQEYKGAHQSIYENTKAYNAALEQIILAHPEQWLWLHKRWKL
jgi:Kdo2-lipid IVA lauroyltransferase/acyltransferase